MINDEDCDVNLPNTNDELSPYSRDAWHLPVASGSQSAFPLIVQVTRCISPMLALSKGIFIPKSTLHGFDEQLDSCLNTFPAHQQIRVHDYLDPRTIHPLIYIQNARLILHRRNLSPFCPPELRTAAIDNCVLAAKDTATILARTMQEFSVPSQSLSASKAWELNLAESASAFLCTHIWRCVLFLCLRREFIVAAVCSRASTVIGKRRAVNSACGRHLAFYLQLVYEKLQREDWSYLEHDEDLLAYASGDLQSTDYSWVWERSEQDSPYGNSDFNRVTGLGASPKKDESVGWNDWHSIVETLERLATEQQRSPQQLLRHQESRDASYLSPPNDSNQQSIVSPGGSSRISIANII